jgi:hypothetical protein
MLHGAHEGEELQSVQACKQVVYVRWMPNTGMA